MGAPKARRGVLLTAAPLAFAAALTVATAGASRESAALCARAFELAYNLDYEPAADLFRKAIDADPADAAAYRGLAAITWLHILFQRGTVLVDDYLGRVTKPHVTMKEPPAEAADLFYRHARQALALAEGRVAADPKDPRAQYDLGAAVALLASYNGTVEGSLFAAFRSARRAFDAHEQVLALDPVRKDAGLIVGTYRYTVSTMSLPLRWMAYVAGFGGDRQRALALIESAAGYAGDTQTDAKFALVLLYNRERRYDDALRVIHDLQRRFPRNRLLWLEEGSTKLRACRPAQAEAALDAGLALLERDRRPRMFAETSLWWYKRGAARVAARRFDAAEADLRKALEGEGRDWVRGRAHTELARIAAARRNPGRARTECEAAIKLGLVDNDPRGVADARRLLRTLSPGGRS